MLNPSIERTLCGMKIPVGIEGRVLNSEHERLK